MDGWPLTINKLLNGLVPSQCFLWCQSLLSAKVAPTINYEIAYYLANISRERTGRARVSVFAKCVYFQAPGTQARPLVRRADKGLLVTCETKIGGGGHPRNLLYDSDHFISHKKISLLKLFKTSWNLSFLKVQCWYHYYGHPTTIFGKILPAIFYSFKKAKNF